MGSLLKYLKISHLNVISQVVGVDCNIPVVDVYNKLNCTKEDGDGLQDDHVVEEEGRVRHQYPRSLQQIVLLFTHASIVYCS